MPQVVLSYRWPVLVSTVQTLSAHIGHIVADALDCEDPGGHLVADDVEVEVKQMSSMDKTKYDLHIVVEAHDFPERMANRDERRERIAEQVRQLFASAGIKKPPAFVWLKPFKGSWGEL